MTRQVEQSVDRSPLWYVALLFYQLGLFVFGIVYLVARLLRRRALKGMGERLGFYSKEIRKSLSDQERPIWLHMVSVGETLSAGPVIQALQAAYPETPWILTTTTDTGRQVAKQWLRPGKDTLLFLPWDFAPVIKRVLDVIRPRLFLVFETELWPVLFRGLAKRDVPVAVINGRISPGAFRRYLWVRPLMQRVLLPVHAFLAQSIQDAQRFAAIGAAKDRIEVAGNVKWDLDPKTVGQNEAIEKLGRQVRTSEDSLIFVAGSTHPGEEALLLNVYKASQEHFPALRFWIAPRHPERIQEIEVAVSKAGLSSVRRSQLDDVEEMPDADTVVLLDTLGELTALYRQGDVVFMGGSLVPIGGHNFIEAAIFGKPILTGSYLHNFEGISQILTDAGGLAIVKDAKELQERLHRLLSSRTLRQRMGAAAQQAVAPHRGTVERVQDIIQRRWGDLLG